MANKSGDISNQSRNMRLLRLRKIFMDETDAEHGITMPEILRHLRAYSIEADRRTIYEDIRVLQESEKMDIEHEPGDHLYRLRSREFSVAELKLIIDSMASSRVLAPETTKALTDKLANLCSKHEREYLKKKVFLDNRIKSENKKVPLYIQTLNEGIIKQRWVAFRYFRYDLNKKKFYYFGGKHRRVRPAALLIINDVYYLLAYDKRDHRKLFRIERMSHVDIHSEGFQHLPEQLTPQLARLAFAVDNPYTTHPVKAEYVTLRFHNAYVDEVLDKFGFAVQLVPDGSYYFKTTVTVEPTPEFFGWIFSLGRAVEIIGPDLVRERMLSKARSQEYMYREKKNKRKPSVY